MKKRVCSLLQIYGMGILVRFLLASSPYQKAIADRIEISTPINSYKRVIEGLHLKSFNINPYIGDIVHETPIHLAAYGILVAACSNYLTLVFVACDVATALLLHIFAIQCTFYLQNTQNKNHKRYCRNGGDMQVFTSDSFIPPKYVAAAYLFNPYTILNCVGYTTTVFANFFTALYLTGLMFGNLLLTTISLSICIFQNLYFVLLISPLIIKFSNKGKSAKQAVAAITFLSIFWSLLMYSSYRINNDLNFINNTYGFILTVPDLRPNIGLFWYFFIEIFEHFRLFFIYSFQINATLLYLVPLSIRLRNEPMLLSASLLFLIAIFKSFPCLGDVGFSLALLCCWKHLFKYIQHSFMEISFLCMTTALAPTLWHLWIYSGSANANFYFGVTLAFEIALIILITDVIFAYVKREYEYVHGRVEKINEQNAKLVLE